MGSVENDLNNILYFDKKTLSSGWLGKNIKCFDVIDSTQTVAKNIAIESPNGTIVLANQQENGRGRLNRKWFSSSNDGLWMSVILKPSIETHTIPQLTLLTSVAMIQTLEAFQIKSEIKWPNDCLVNGKKIAGILTESAVNEGQIDYIVVGVGLNLFQSKENMPEEIQNIATSMEMNTELSFSKFEVLEKFILKMEALVDIFLKDGFSLIREQWLKHTLSIGKSVFVDMGQKKEFGTISDLSPEGYLLLKNEENNIVPILYGDVHFL